MLKWEKLIKDKILVFAFMWDGFAETVTKLPGNYKSAAAFAQVFVNLMDEIKDSLRQSIFMKLFEFQS